MESLITGVVFSELNEQIGPVPRAWFPPTMDERVASLVSIKTISLLAGEEDFVPNSEAIIPFPSINQKGIVKYVQWHDQSHRGGVGWASITVLFKETDDAIFYKYKKNFENCLDEIVQKAKDLEVSKSSNDEILEELRLFRENLSRTLDDLRSKELIDTKREEFPEIEQSELENAQYRFKVIVVGDPAVGKTSLILRFTDNAFNRNLLPTIGVSISEKVIPINQEKSTAILIIWDLAGTQKFDAMRTHFYEKAAGMFIVFDLTDIKSFESVNNWYQDILKSIKERHRTIGVLVGNKSDLVKERKISRIDAEKLAKSINCEYIETSALTGENVDNSFSRMTYALINVKKILNLQRR